MTAILCNRGGYGIILFMEEIGENLRNIDRMFNSIQLHGVMENVKVTDKGATLSFNIKGKEKNVETDKLTAITKLSKALLKMFAGKTFNVEE